MNDALPNTIAVTGATGLLGSRLCTHFAGLGCAVRALCRDPARAPRHERITAFACDLPGVIDPAGLAGAECVIHAAYSMRSRGRAEDSRVNLDGTRRLLAAAREAGVGRYVFISSVSAHEAALGFYGQSKLMLERELDPARDLIVRPGLILSRHAGLFVRMLNTVRKTGVAPMFGGGRQIIQTIHIDDLAAALERALRLRLTGALAVCETGGLEMRELFTLMGTLLGRRVRIVSLPFGPVLLALRTVEAAGMRLAVSSDNLLGLKSMRPAESRESLARLGMTVRTAEESLRDLLASETQA